MNFSQTGEGLVKGFESYLRPLGDGSDRCIAYQCPAGKWTLGWGCTEGVKPGMIWTRVEAQAAFDREIAKHVSAVLRLVSVELNQNQFDALVSFSYNVGAGGLATSTLLSKLNAGDYAGAQKEFLRWDKAKDKNTGKTVTMRGLSIRRAAEAELFARRTDHENEVKGELVMPQEVAAPKEPMSGTTKAVIATTGGTGVSVGLQVAANALQPSVVPPPPPIVVDTVANLGAWHAMGKSIAALSTSAWSAPAAVIICACVAFGVLWIPKIWKRLRT